MKIEFYIANGRVIRMLDCFSLLASNPTPVINTEDLECKIESFQKAYNEINQI